MGLLARQVNKQRHDGVAAAKEMAHDATAHSGGPMRRPAASPISSTGCGSALHPALAAVSVAAAWDNSLIVRIRRAW